MLQRRGLAFAFCLILAALPLHSSLKFSLEVDGQAVDVEFDQYQSLRPQAAEIMNFEVGEKKLSELLGGGCDDVEDVNVCSLDRVVGTMEVRGGGGWSLLSNRGVFAD